MLKFTSGQENVVNKSLLVISREKFQNIIDSFSNASLNNSHHARLEQNFCRSDRFDTEVQLKLTVNLKIIQIVSVMSSRFVFFVKIAENIKF